MIPQKSKNATYKNIYIISEKKTDIPRKQKEHLECNN